jgi:hypothetical protein
MAILSVRVDRSLPGRSEEEFDRINRGFLGNIAEKDVAVVGTVCLQGRVRVRLCLIRPLRKKEDVTTVIEEMDGVARGLERDFTYERMSLGSSN